MKFDVTETNFNQGWGRTSSTRTRILAWYIMLMICSTLASILAIRQILFLRLESRVEKSQVQEMKEFRILFEQKTSNHRQPSNEDVVDIFDKFISRNVPDDDEYFLTLIDGRLYKASPEALPPLLKSNSKLIKRWAQMTQPQQGEEVIGFSPVPLLVKPPQIRYRIEPLRTTNGNRAVFVVAHVSTGEWREVDEAVAVVTQVTISLLALASVIAWAAAGRILAPLSLLTDAARSISESDLTRRIPVKGSDEIAELTTTFNDMLDRLQSAFAAQRDFINDAGHELRTPITIIRGHLELLGDDPEDRRETVELVIDELDRISRFVNDLLLLAKAEHPNFLKLETVETSALIEEIYTKAKALAERDWRLENQSSGTILVDRQRLTQAMVNLAQNATQHTKPGDVIVLGVALTQDKARFWVRDTGEGIAFSDQKKIFERFARAANSQRRSEGAGLGLAIVRAIAQAHSGQIELFSRPGGGSTFTIVLPLKPHIKSQIS